MIPSVSNPADSPSKRALHQAWRVFQSIPEGRELDSVAFEELTRAETGWLYPAIFDVHGEQLTLHGPVETVEFARRRKVRFVAVKFYWPSKESRHMAHEVYAAGWGWQGENQLIHLLTDHQLLARDPMALPEIDRLHAQFLRNDRGHREAWEADA